MPYAAGFDLGTTFTAAAVVRDGHAEMVNLGAAAAAIPSVLHLRDDATVTAGRPALRRALAEPDRVARAFKRRMGDPTPIVVGGTPYAAHTLMGRLLRWANDVVTERQGSPPDIVGLTHPANWGPYKREVLQQVLETANVANAVTLSEPEAAAIAYAAGNRVEEGETIAVYDLGGGTFDAAVLAKTADGFEILGTPMGIEALGGIDFDEAVWHHVVDNLNVDLAELDHTDAAVALGLNELRDACVEAKIALSTDTDTIIPVILPAVQTQIRITRQEFETRVRPLIGDTVSSLRRAVTSAGVAADDLSRVLLVGGSSRIPLVGQMVSEELQRPVAVDADPKNAIATGAALYAAREFATSAAPAPAEPVAAPPPVPPTVFPTDPPTAEQPLVAQPPPPADPPPVVPPPVTPPPPQAPSPPQPPAASPPPAEQKRRRRGWLLPAAAVLVVAGLIGGGLFFILAGDEASADDEVFLEPVSSVGIDPFTPDTVPDRPELNPPVGQLVDFDLAPLTFPDGGGKTVTVTGGAVGLYGGTTDVSVCDKDQLVQFLQANPDKAAAWAGVHGISVDEIASFVAGLTDVVLKQDTLVTNHGFTDGAANPIQSILQAGNAVLVDEFGVPRVRCKCGNPLLEPVPLADDAKLVGDPWEGLDPTRAIAVVANPDPIEEFEIDDLNGAEPLFKLPGAEGPDATKLPADFELTLDGPTPTPEPTEEAEPTETPTATPEPEPTPTPPPPTATPAPEPFDLTGRGIVEVSSIFSGDFRAELAVDNDLTTSWFSAGSGQDGGVSVFEWIADDVVTIEQLSILSNADHANRDFRTGFGFDSVRVTIGVTPSSIVFDQTFSLAGTPDPDVIVPVGGVEGAIVRLEFSGHEDPTCGGFAELFVFGFG